MTTIASTAAVDILSTKPNIRRSPSKKDRKSLKKMLPYSSAIKSIVKNHQRKLPAIDSIHIHIHTNSVIGKERIIGTSIFFRRIRKLFRFEKKNGKFKNVFGDRAFFCP